MHAVTFALKRGHLRTVAFGQQVLEAVPGMTPARFDLLCLLRQAGIWRGVGAREGGLAEPMRQTEIWQRLDLCRTTVSKMLKRLEEIGWIRREIHPRYKKWKLVFFTAEGLRAIWKAMKIMFRQRVMLRYFERIMHVRRPQMHIVEAIYNLWEDIFFVALCFGDRSKVHYDMGAQYDPDEAVPSRQREPFAKLYRPPPAKVRPPKRRREEVRPLAFR